MQGSYKLTIDDWAEAGAVSARGSFWIALGWVIGLLFVLAQTIQQTYDYHALTTLRPNTPSARLMIGLIPAATLGLIAAVRMWFAPRIPVPWSPPPRKTMNWWPSILMALGMFFVVDAVQSETESAAVAGRRSLFERSPDLLIPFTATLIVTLPRLLLSARRRRIITNQVMIEQIKRHEVVQWKATEADIYASTPHIDVRYRWEYFRGYRETRNLLILYQSRVGYVLIPKRTFADEQELVAFFALVSKHIPRGIFLPRPQGFPVLKAIPVAAIAESPEEPQKIESSLFKTAEL